MNEAYLMVLNLLNAKENKSLVELPNKSWVENIDEHWIIAIHANQDQEIEFNPEGTMGGEAKFGEMLIWFNGWLAGILTPGGGTIAAGKVANENTFIEAIESKIKELKK